MLDVDSLSFDYQDRPLLHDISWSLAPGQLLYLRGGNGAGKTTLMRLLAGLLRPQAGEIRYESQSINNNLTEYQQKLCYLGHKTGLNPLLTVKENCCFDMHWGRRECSLDELLKQFGLKELSQELCHHLSAGQKRRVGLLRLAMTDAKLWLLDEPFVALDNNAATLLMHCLETHLAQGGQVILTSHQLFALSHLDYLEYVL